MCDNLIFSQNALFFSLNSATLSPFGLKQVKFSKAVEGDLPWQILILENPKERIELAKATGL